MRERLRHCAHHEHSYRAARVAYTLQFTFRQPGCYTALPGQQQPLGMQEGDTFDFEVCSVACGEAIQHIVLPHLIQQGASFVVHLVQGTVY